MWSGGVGLASPFFFPASPDPSLFVGFTKFLFLCFCGLVGLRVLVGFVGLGC